MTTVYIYKSASARMNKKGKRLCHDDLVVRAIQYMRSLGCVMVEYEETDPNRMATKMVFERK